MEIDQTHKYLKGFLESRGWWILTSRRCLISPLNIQLTFIWNFVLVFLVNMNQYTQRYHHQPHAIKNGGTICVRCIYTPNNYICPVLKSTTKWVAEDPADDPGPRSRADPGQIAEHDLISWVPCYRSKLTNLASPDDALIGGYTPGTRDPTEYHKRRGKCLEQQNNIWLWLKMRISWTQKKNKVKTRLLLGWNTYSISAISVGQSIRCGFH